MMPRSIAHLIGEQPMHAETTGLSNARVWKVGTQFYLKVGIAADEVADEAVRLQWLAGRAPVPRVIACERDGDEVYLLTEAIDGVAAHSVVDSRLEAVRTLAAGLRLLHGLDICECPFDARLAVTIATARDNTLAGRVVILRDGVVAAFIDVGRAGVADRHQDFACAARSIAYNYGEAFVAPFFDAYGMVPDPARIEFYQLLDEFF